jgi:hypothetical protein
MASPEKHFNRSPSATQLPQFAIGKPPDGHGIPIENQSKSQPEVILA